MYDELENANLHEGELEKLKSQINAIENNQQLNEILNDLKTYILYFYLKPCSTVILNQFGKNWYDFL